MSTLFHRGFVAMGALALAGVVFVGVQAGCDNLDQTSDVPDPDGAPDYDAGFVPVQNLDDSGVGTPATPDAGAAPASARVRIANLLVGSPAIDVCARAGSSGAFDPAKITNGQVPNPAGIAYGQVSTHFFVPVASAKGQAYSFRIVPVGTPCDGAMSSPIADVSPAPTLQQGGGVTISVVGRFGVDGGDSAPKATSASDVVNVPPTIADLRVFHGVPDMPAFDVLVDGENVLPGVRYGSILFYPYSTATGFAQLAAGVNANATLTLQVGTTLKSFVVPERIRRGVAMTIFASGSFANPSLSLCSDRTPDGNATLATCTPLAPKK